MVVLVGVLFLVAAIANLIPVVGVVSAERLQSLYGVALEDPNLVVLLRHRAVLFGIVGALLAAAAFHEPLRMIALAAGLVSMLSFVAVAYAVEGLNGELQRVLAVDVVVSVLLAIGGVLSHLQAGRVDGALG